MRAIGYGQNEEWSVSEDGGELARWDNVNVYTLGGESCRYCVGTWEGEFGALYDFAVEMGAERVLVHNRRSGGFVERIRLGCPGWAAPLVCGYGGNAQNLAIPLEWHRDGAQGLVEAPEWVVEG